MKRTMILFMACFALLAASCTKSNNQVVVPNETYFVTVKSGDWKTTDGGKTYSANYSVPAITGDVNANWGVLVYASFSNGVYEAIPEVYNGIAYSYSHSVGTLSFDIQASDGSTVISPPGAFTVKLVLVPSN